MAARQRFAGKAVVVTGAAQGIGWGVALAVAAEGGGVLAVDRAAVVHEVVAEIVAAGGIAAAFEADLEHFAEWDPGTVRVARVATDPGAPDAYDVTVRTFGREQTFRYEIVESEPSRRLVLVAETSMLRLADRITIAESPDGGSVVTYEAELTLRGPLKLAGPLFAPGFRRTVERGAAGLRSALDGVFV